MEGFFVRGNQQPKSGRKLAFMFLLLGMMTM